MSNQQYRILHVLSGDLWGGSEVQVVLQVEALRAAGVAVEVVLFNDLETAQHLRERGVPCHIVEESKGLKRLFTEGFEVLKNFSPNLLVSHGYKEGIFAWRLGKKLGIPFVSTWHGATENYSGLSALKTALALCFYKWLCRVSAKRIICVSEALGEELGFSSVEKCCWC